MTTTISKKTRKDVFLNKYSKIDSSGRFHKITQA